MFTILVVAAVTFAASLAASYLLSSSLKARTYTQTPLTEDDLSMPTVSEATPIAVIFGTRDITNPIVAWYGNLKQVGSDYTLGVHLVLCQSASVSGAVALTRITWGEKVCWIGNIKGLSISTSGGTIRENGLFTDGNGISGDFVFYTGININQTFDQYMLGLGLKVGFYGWKAKKLISVVLKDVNLGASPSLRAPSFRIQRTLTDWYPEKATIEYIPKSFPLEFYSIERGDNTYAFEGYLTLTEMPETLILNLVVPLFTSSNDTTPASDTLEVIIKVNGVTAYAETKAAATSHTLECEILAKYLTISKQTFKVFLYTAGAAKHISSPTPSKLDLQLCPDMNPAHVIRECLTDTVWGMGLPATEIDDTSFTYAADYLYNEGMGVSVKWSKSSTIQSFVAEILRHIDAVLFTDHTTGLFRIKLVRQDYSFASLLTLDKSNVAEVKGWKRTAFDDLQNTVTATYYNTTMGAAAGITVSNIALVQEQGLEIVNNVDYPAFSTARNASRAAQRQLTVISTPLLNCTIVANSDAGGLDIGDAFNLNWQKYWPDTVTMRVMRISFGDGKKNQVTIEATEDIFGTPAAAFIS